MLRAALIASVALATMSANPCFAQATMAGMIEAIKEDTRRTAFYTGVAELDPRVIDAMSTVKRDEFVPWVSKISAYVNRPLLIGHGQTISQPYIVAIMTHLMEAREGDRVLEIGTGSGYQAAVLAELVDEVYTIEIIPELAESASKRLARLGFDNVEVRTGDGWYGWPDKAPFDAIMVTAVGEDVPGELVRQLKPGGRIVLPLGTDWDQNLVVVEKAEDGTTSKREILPVRFVPLTGDH
ncbi:MAG: protein-L-isoaspartate(D-aspartate) O-methyltransferase [Gammaproteobacteria bacterium]|nr:protein-L-isoaspartate(D-aspartate) O-methyltransferase [Gammaproteobacteria bacterium]